MGQHLGRAPWTGMKDRVGDQRGGVSSWSPSRSWEGRRRLPESIPPPGGRGRGTLALGNSKKRTLDPASYQQSLLSPPHPSPQDLASPRPSLRPFLHFHSLPAPSAEFPPFLSPPFLPPRPWPSPSATSPLTRFLWTSCCRGLGVSPPSLEPSRAPDDSPVPTLGRAPVAPNFSQLNFPPRHRQASPLRARPLAHRARPRRSGLGGAEWGPRPGGGGALPGKARHWEPSAEEAAPNVPRRCPARLPPLASPHGRPGDVVSWPH